jgi:peroxiredoxin
VAVALPLVEMAVGIGLIPAISAGWAAAAAIGLLAVFVGAITLALARGRRPACRCFGQVHSSPVGGQTVARNIVLGAMAAFVVWGSATGHNPGALAWAATVTPARWLLGAAVVVLLAALAVEGWFVVNLARQQGRLLLRLEALEASNSEIPHPHEREAQGLAVGSIAPVFELPGLYGETLTLQALRSERRPVLLVFSDPGCGPCAQLMLQVANWQDHHRQALTIAVISHGDPDANRVKADEAGVRSVLLQKDFEIGDKYMIAGTPSAVLVNVDGKIASPIAAGIDAITALVTSVTTAPSTTGHHATAPPIGALAPNFTLPDNDDRPVSLGDFRRRRALLLFWNPACGFCARMLDELREWETTALRAAPQLVIVSTGTAAQNIEMGLHAPVLQDPSNTVAPTFGVNGTPMAVLVDGQGRIASHPAAGAEAVFELARNLLDPLTSGQAAAAQVVNSRPATQNSDTQPSSNG